MPVNTTFDAHGRGLNVRDEECECTLIAAMHKLRTIQTLLALTLLHEEVTATLAVERKLAASGTTDPLLCASVGLELWHTVTRV